MAMHNDLARERGRHESAVRDDLAHAGKLKALFRLMLTLMLTLALAACGGETPGASEESKAPITTTATATATATATPADTPTAASTATSTATDTATATPAAMATDAASSTTSTVVAPTANPTAAASTTASVAGIPATDAATMEVTDARGDTVTLTRGPQRVIVIDPATCDIFYSIGAQDSLVAVGSFCEYPAEVSEKTKVGAYDQLNVEELVALTPDLILFGDMSTDEAKYESLKQAGIEVVAFSADTLAEAYANVETFGELMGKEAEAQAVVDDMRARLAAVSDLGESQAQKPTVYVEISPLASGLYSCGAGTFINELLDIAGGRNVFADQSGWIAVSEEQVIAMNPDVIISTTQYEGYDPAAEISARAGWDGLSAVQNGMVLHMDPSLSSLASPRLVLGAEELYGLLYPAE